MHGEPNSLPIDMGKDQPKTKKVDAQINIDNCWGNFNGSGLGEHFYVRWSGVIRIAAAGKYTFATESDDGTRLFLDGKMVVDNNGVHGVQQKTGDVDLTAGDHQLRVEYFQYDRGMACKLLWASAGQALKIVPAEVLFHKED